MLPLRFVNQKPESRCVRAVANTQPPPPPPPPPPSQSPWPVCEVSRYQDPPGSSAAKHENTVLCFRYLPYFII